MRTRWLPWTGLLALFALPTSTPAQAPAPPTLVVRLRSLDTLFESGKLLAAAVGKEQVLTQLEDFLKSKIGPKGLEGIDLKRPLGLYAQVGKELTDLKAVLLVPVANEKAFLDMLAGLNFKAEKDANGLYTVKQNLLPVEVVFRFAHHYAYITALNPEAVAPGALIEPGKLFPAKQTSALSLTLRLDQVPAMAKEIIAQHLLAEVAKLETKEKGVSDAQHVVKTALMRELSKQLLAVVRDGVELHADVDVHRKTNALTADVTLTAKPNSALARTLEKLGKGKSLFTGLMRDDAAMNGLVHYSLPEKLKDALGALVSEATKKALAETTDPAKQKQVVRLLEALAPTFKAGEIDLGFSLRGPGVGDRYTLVAGLKLQDADKVAATLRDLVQDLPEGDRAKVKLDVEKVGGTTIHALDVGKGLDAKAKGLFGDGPAYLAFRADAVFLALGADGLTALKEAVAAPAAAGAPLRLEMSLGRLAAALAANEGQAKEARRLLKQGDDGRFRISLEGGPRMRLRLHVGLSVLRLLSRFNELAVEKK